MSHLRRRPVSRPTLPTSPAPPSSLCPPRRAPAPPHPGPDRPLLLALTLAALATRLFRLAHPRAVVFDELHFLSFLENHIQSRFSFDIHPWGGKLTLALLSRLLGYVPTNMSFLIAAPYPSSSYLLPRLIAALFGVAIVPLTFLLARALPLSPLAAALAAALPLFDGLLLTQSRLALLDSQLVFYLNLTLLCALRLWHLSHPARPRTPRYYLYLLATAVAAAAALSVKWTAAVTPFLVALVSGLGLVFLRKPTPALHCVLAAALALFCYLVPWFLHLRLSMLSTPMAMRMGDRFRSTLRGNHSFPYNPHHNVSFFDSVYELHWRQFRANQKVKTRHAWETRWYEWPLNLRGILYYVDKADTYTDDHPVARIIYLLQNPAGAIWVFVAVVSFAVMLPILYRYRTFIPKEHPLHNLMSSGSFLLAGYLLNLVPYMFVERCYFLYHYLPALTYGQLLTALLVDHLPRIIRVPLTAIILLSVFAAFIFWAPWIYAMPIDNEGVVRRQWMPRWN